MSSSTPVGEGRAAVEYIPAKFEMPDYSERLILARDRPLFAENRQRPKRSPPPPSEEQQTSTEAAPEEVQPPERTEPLDVIVLGIARIGTTSTVLLRDMDSGKESWKSEGDVVMGWTLYRIGADQVVFQRDGITEVEKIHR